MSMRSFDRSLSQSGSVQAHDLAHYESTSLEYQLKISRFLESMELSQEDELESRSGGGLIDAHRGPQRDDDDAELVAKICRAKAKRSKPAALLAATTM